MNWERPAFGGNALRLDFRRLVTDSVSLEFGLASHSDVDSKEYTYQNVTHSPYFAMGRDSTQIPFGGRNIAMNSMHIQPILTWRFGWGAENYLEEANTGKGMKLPGQLVLYFKYVLPALALFILIKGLI